MKNFMIEKTTPADMLKPCHRRKELMD